MTTVKIDNNNIQVEIADTDEKRTKGLSGRDSLESGSGMIFVYDEAKEYPIWMKDMKFPIDIIWINEGKVVYIANFAKPEEGSEYYKIYKPDKPAKYVLEVPAGYSKQNSINVGDSVESPIFK